MADQPKLSVEVSAAESIRSNTTEERIQQLLDEHLWRPLFELAVEYNGSGFTPEYQQRRNDHLLAVLNSIQASPAQLAPAMQPSSEESRVLPGGCLSGADRVGPGPHPPSQ